MSIESNIRTKAVVLYVVAAIVVAAIILILYGLKTKVANQKSLVENQYHSLALTNRLVSALNDAQSSSALYIATRDSSYIHLFVTHKMRIDLLIDSLEHYQGIEKERLDSIGLLLNQQTNNIAELNKRFTDKNPVESISERIKNYKPEKKENLNIIKIKKDTIIKSSDKKGFFVRLKEVFSPAKDSTIVITNQHTDTLKVNNTHSPAIISEIGKIAKTASNSYLANIRSIEFQVSELIAADRKISGKITGMIIELQQTMVKDLLKSIDKNEKSINSNYTISIAGGVVALVIILLFIILIIYDVNKGKEAREKIKQLMESRHQLLLSVSHDIKSPLTSILGYSERKNQNSETSAAVGNSARYILSLLENLLEFSSLEQGALTTTFSDFDLKAMCEEIVQMFKPLAEAKHLGFDYESVNMRIHSDQIKVKQITINLISNAIKYTSEGNVSLRISYTDQKILIRVKDTGAGIPTGKIPELYKPFTRLESNNTLAHGSGLGMYVVKGLLDMLGGTIQIDSIVGKGTEIEVIIPVTEASTPLPAGAKKIQVYDDDPVVLRLTEDMLLQLGHQITEKDGDMILTDMEMGTVSGLDILKKAGSKPVVLMTGKSDFTLQQAILLGFSDYLPKPFTINHLKNIFGEGEISKIDDLLGDDREEIMEIFKIATAENFSQLSNALENSDFDKAQSICHKMLPMFLQLGYPSDELKRMDIHKSDAYNGWKEDVANILLIKV